MTSLFTPEEYETQVQNFRENVRTYLRRVYEAVTFVNSPLFSTETGSINTTATATSMARDGSPRIYFSPETLETLLPLILETAENIDTVPMSFTLSSIQSIHDTLLNTLSHPNFSAQNPLSPDYYLKFLKPEIRGMQNASLDVLPNSGTHPQWTPTQRDAFAKVIESSVESISNIIQKSFVFKPYQQAIDAWEKVLQMELLAGLLNEDARIENAALKIKGDEQKVQQNQITQRLEKFHRHLQNEIENNPEDDENQLEEIKRVAREEAVNYAIRYYRTDSDYFYELADQKYKEFLAEKKLALSVTALTPKFLDPDFLSTLQSIQNIIQSSNVTPEVLKALQQTSPSAKFLSDIEPCLELLRQQLLVPEHQKLVQQHAMLIEHEKYTHARQLMSERVGLFFTQHSDNLAAQELPPLQKIRSYAIKGLQALSVNVDTPSFMVDLKRPESYQAILDLYNLHSLVKMSTQPQSNPQNKPLVDTFYGTSKKEKLQEAIAALSPSQRSDLRKEFEQSIIPEYVNIAVTMVQAPDLLGGFVHGRSLQNSRHLREDGYVKELLRKHASILDNLDSSPYYRALREEKNHDEILQTLQSFTTPKTKVSWKDSMSDLILSHASTESMEGHSEELYSSSFLNSLTEKMSEEAKERNHHIQLESLTNPFYKGPSLAATLEMDVSRWDISNTATTGYPYVLDFIKDYVQPQDVLERLKTFTKSLPTALLRLQSPYEGAYEASVFLEKGGATLAEEAKTYLERQKELIRASALKMVGSQTVKHEDTTLEQGTDLLSIDVTVPTLPQSLKHVKGNRASADPHPTSSDNPSILKR